MNYVKHMKWWKRNLFWWWIKQKKRGIKDLLYAIKANTMKKRFVEIEDEVKKMDGTLSILEEKRKENGERKRYVL